VALLEFRCWCRRHHSAKKMMIKAIADPSALRPLRQHIRMRCAGSAFTGLLTEQSIAISMDGKGASRDNVFVERLWRTIKYEELYLRAYESVSDARASIGRYLRERRPHASLDGMTPDQAYFTPLPFRSAA
jgi:transposase InsO family protein